MDSSYSYLRQFTPGVLAAVDFTGGPGTADLMAAVAILKSLNASGGRQSPGRRARLVRACQVRRLPGEGPQGRRRHRLPALLGAVRDPGSA